jgi:hypothetical protein
MLGSNKEKFGCLNKLGCTPILETLAYILVSPEL